jgi:hypothetical protein
MDGLWQHLPQLGFAAGLALACWLLMRRAARRIGRQSRENSASQVGDLLPEKSRDRALLDAPPEVARWQVELHETARELKAEIDSKLLALQALVNVAREERARLEAALERAKATERGTTSGEDVADDVAGDVR